VAREELTNCNTLMAEHGIRPRSMVFPGNLIGNTGVLREMGIIAFRGQEKRGYIGHPKVISKGLWRIPSTIQIGGLEEPQSLVAEIRELIDRAVRSSGLCHIWFHPEETDPTIISKVLVPILDYVKGLESKGLLTAATMQNIASYCETGLPPISTNEPSGSNAV